MDIIDSIITTEATRNNVRAMLPVLIFWAQTGQTNHTYEDLANAVGKKRGTWIGHVLGCIQDVIDELSKRKERKIPTLNALVNSKDKGLPSGGFEYVYKDYPKMSEDNKHIYIKGLNKVACDYKHWDWVLSELELSPYKSLKEDEIKQIKHIHSGSHGGGEGYEHRQLKEYILNHPGSIGIKEVKIAETEYTLPSGDKLDIYFKLNDESVVAVEVKSSISDDADLTRGIFQCVKYKAVLNSLQRIEGTKRNITVILVTGRSLSDIHYKLISILAVNHKLINLN